MSGSIVNEVARIGQGYAGSQLFDASSTSWSGSSWFQQLQPGSWRGVGFVLDAGDTKAGRRVAIHEYPYRDDAWVEDLGKLPRRFGVQAFLVGDDVYEQRDAMLQACEQSGAGTLVHPTLGTLQCVLLDFQVTDRRERGRVVEVAFAFIVAGDVKYPTTALATGQNVMAQASSLTSASASDLGAVLSTVGNVPNQAMASVGQFTSMATSAVGDATQIFNSVRGLAGFFGRYAGGSRATVQPATATVQGLLSASTTARTLVNNTAALVNTAASFL